LYFGTSLGKPTHRLTLFYLANDVIQHARKKGCALYTEGFAEVLPQATAFVRDPKVSPKIERVFGIWLERSVYSESFVGELREILHGSGQYAQQATSKIVAEFKLDELTKQMQSLRSAISSSERQLKSVSTGCCVKVDSLTLPATLAQLKDKAHGEQFSREFDEWHSILSNAITSLESQVQARISLLSLLEKSEIFYETQQNEAKIVANAYTSFANRVKAVREQLHRQLNSNDGQSVSPLIDAPSPTGSDDGLVLPGSDSPLPGMRSLLTVFAEQSKAAKPSSLDQRLSSLMQNMPSVGNAPTAASQSPVGLTGPDSKSNSVTAYTKDRSQQTNHQSTTSTSTKPNPAHANPSYTANDHAAPANHSPLSNADQWPPSYPHLSHSTATAAYGHFDSPFGQSNKSYSSNMYSSPNMPPDQRYGYAEQMYNPAITSPPIHPPPPPPPISSMTHTSNDYYGLGSTSYGDFDRKDMLRRRDRVDHNSISNNLIDIRSSDRLQSQIQQIRPLVSARDVNQLTGNELIDSESLRPLGSAMPKSVDPSNQFDAYNFDGENFEPADMELGNSDDEDQLNRSCNSQRVLKVIETSDSQPTVETLNGASSYSLHSTAGPSLTHTPNVGPYDRAPIQNYSPHPSQHHFYQPNSMHHNHTPPNNFRSKHGPYNAPLESPAGASRWRNRAPQSPVSSTSSASYSSNNYDARLPKYRNNSSNRKYYH
jgi:hypothetical protein